MTRCLPEDQVVTLRQARGDRRLAAVHNARVLLRRLDGYR